MADIINTLITNYDYKILFFVYDAFFERIFKSYKRFNNFSRNHEIFANR